MKKNCQKLCAELHTNCAAKDSCHLENAKVGGRYIRALRDVLSSFSEVTGCDVSADIDKYSRRCDDRVSLKICEMDEKSKELPLLAKSEESDDKLPTIIVILESPDVSEYKKATTSGSTAEPARGRTGYAIMEYLVNRLKTDEHFKQWRIALINPIQYSCSLGRLLSPRRKKYVFNSLFTGDIVECFKRRLDAMKKNRDYAIINCCTKDGRDKIDEILNNQDTSFLNMTHPSSWHYLKDKELQCRVNGKGDTQKFTVEILQSVIVYKNKALRSF